MWKGVITAYKARQRRVRTTNILEVEVIEKKNMTMLGKDSKKTIGARNGDRYQNHPLVI